MLTGVSAAKRKVHGNGTYQIDNWEMRTRRPIQYWLCEVDFYSRSVPGVSFNNDQPRCNRVYLNREASGQQIQCCIDIIKR